MKTIKNKEPFHTVGFMRQVRNEMTEQFQQNRQKYLEYVKTAMDDLKRRQKNSDHEQLTEQKS